MQTLTVHLNRDGIHDLEAPRSFSADGPFVVDLVNHGKPVHVHLNVDDQLSTAVRLGGGNHFVEAGETVRVDVEVNPDAGPTSGRLKVVTGYGAETAYVTVSVDPQESEASRVQVDESLSKPKPDPPEPTLTEQVSAALSRRSTLPAVALVALAVGVAIGAGVAMNSAAVLLGALVVVLGAVAAVAILFR